VTPSTSMSALARRCFNAFSATIARRWAQGSAPLRQLSTNNTPVDDPLLWGRLLDTTKRHRCPDKADCTVPGRGLAGSAQEEHCFPHSSEQHVYRHALDPFTSDTGSTIIVTGRSIAVKKDLTDTSVASACAILASRIWRNKVRQDYMANMRHEKKGVKRRRLESERWRRRFADHVRSASQQVLFLMSHFSYPGA
jgi:hypothetical protein